MKLKNKSILLLILLTLVLATIYGISYAKYVSNSIWNYYLETKKFYFESDHLSINIINNINNNWDGSNVTFNLKNSKNNTLISDYNISYTAKCTIDGDLANNAQCMFLPNESNVVTGTLSSIKQCINYTNDGVDVSSFNELQCKDYNYELKESINELQFKIVGNNEETITDATVIIEVSSSDPFVKTLKGRFVLHKNSNINGDITMNYNSLDSYERLTLTNTYNDNKCVRLSFNPNDLKVDYEGENYNTDLNGYINEITINMEPNSEKSFVFYKQDFTKTYNLTYFSLEELDRC